MASEIEQAVAEAALTCCSPAYCEEWGRELLAALAERGYRIVRDEGLDAAWAEAEAALPEGWAIRLLWGTTTEDRWGADAGPWPAKPGDPATFGAGPTPAAALRSLAAKLRNSDGR